jgi:hypothetical protein
MRTRQTRFLKGSISHSTTAATLGVLVWLGLALLPVREAVGQGTVILANQIPGGPGVGITLHIWGPSPMAVSLIGLGSNDNPSGSTPFGSTYGMDLIGTGGSGGHYGYATTFAQLIGAVGAGQPLSALVPVGLTTTFQSGAGLGAIVPITDTLVGIPKDAPAATFAIVAWDNSSGMYPTWTQASVAWMGSQIRAGMSAPFTVTSIGGDRNPPPNLNNDHGSANGMTSFNLYGDCIYCGKPLVATGSASAITTNSATLHATVNPNGYPTSAWFQWTTNFNSYGNITAPTGVGSGTSTLLFSTPLAGLTPNTTYYYCALADNGSGRVSGTYGMFTTLMAPTVTTWPAAAITATSATLNATANPNGWPTTAWFQWGATTNYGSLTSLTNLGSGTNALPLSAPLVGLTPNTIYHFRAAATNSAGVVYGNDQSFQSALAPLIIHSGSGSWDAASSNLSYTVTAGLPGSPHEFILLQSPDPMAPLSAWTRVATNASVPGSFPIPPVGTAAPKYYRIKIE